MAIRVREALNWIVYMLRCIDDSIYTGITNNLPHRLSQHQQGIASKYTRSRLPIVLLGYFWVPSKSIALKEEYRIKQLSHQEKLKLIKEPKMQEVTDRISITKRPRYSLEKENVAYYMQFNFVGAGKNIVEQRGGELNYFDCPLMKGLSDQEIQDFKRAIRKNTRSEDLLAFCVVECEERGRGVFALAKKGTTIT